MPPSIPTLMPPGPTPLQHPYTNIKPMKQGLIHLQPPPGAMLDPDRGRRKPGLLRHHKRTKPWIWCCAFLCLVFSLLLILAGIITIIVFVVIKPRNPNFDTTSASLNGIYLDSPAYLNGDFMLLANFSNPNRKIDVVFEYVNIELFFGNRRIATRVLPPFGQRSGEARLEAVHFVSSEVYLPLELIMELQKQVKSNRVVYSIRGTFKIKASLGFLHFTYWIYGRCQIELSGPPGGVLVARSCRMKK